MSTYDQWKLMSPDDERDRFLPYDDEERENECDHEDYEADILTGRAYCGMCSHSWYLSGEEVAAEQERICAYNEWQQEQERPWCRFKQWASSQFSFWKRKLRRRRIAVDDDIPF